MNDMIENNPKGNVISVTNLPDSEKHTRSKELQISPRAAVIGGGPSGIQAAGELIKCNFHVTLFERHNQLGGIWRYDRKEHLSHPSPAQGVKPFLPRKVSPVYKEMRTNVPFQAMGIDGFPIPQEDHIRFAHRTEILDYLKSYVRHLEQEYPGLIEYRFNSNIESVTHDHGWSIQSRASGRVCQEKFDIVVVATGAFHTPLVANLHDKEFTGISFHSLYYDDPSVLENRTVLIVGGGNSARDVFWDAMKYAKRVVLASPTEQKRNNVVLPEINGARSVAQYTTVGRVKRILKDGTVIHTNWQGQEEILEDTKVDLIIYCTGYKREFSFLPQALQPILTGPDGREITNCYMYTAHKEHPNSLFFFHPSKARTPFNTMARDTHEQARLIAALAYQDVFTREQLEMLDETLQGWLDHLYAEWAKETLNSCSCAVQNPLFMNFLNCVVNSASELSARNDIGSAVMGFVRSRMNETAYRKQNTIWHAGMELRERANAVNWNVFRFLSGELTAGPDVDGAGYFAVTWYRPDGSKHSTFYEDAIKYEDLILNGKSDEQTDAVSILTTVDSTGYPADKVMRIYTIIDPITAE